jgi:ABC-type branched-subunit amino acid transport system ATPase component
MTQAQLAQGNAPLLAVRDVSVVFGGIIALNGVSFDMHKGAILGLIGPNGAGKTTLFNCLSRLYQPSSGDILMEGASILTRRRTGSPRSASAAPSRTSRCFPISRCSTMFASAPIRAPPATSSRTR